MFELLINKLFDKRKVENNTKCITVVTGENRKTDYKPIKHEKTALWTYFASMDGLNVKERGYAVSVSRTREEYPQSLDFCR